MLLSSPPRHPNPAPTGPPPANPRAHPVTVVPATCRAALLSDVFAYLFVQGNEPPRPANTWQDDASCWTVDDCPRPLHHPPNATPRIRATAMMNPRRLPDFLVPIRALMVPPCEAVNGTDVVLAVPKPAVNRNRHDFHPDLGSEATDHRFSNSFPNVRREDQGLWSLPRNLRSSSR